MTVEILVLLAEVLPTCTVVLTMLSSVEASRLLQKNHSVAAQVTNALVAPSWCPLWQPLAHRESGSVLVLVKTCTGHTQTSVTGSCLLALRNVLRRSLPLLVEVPAAMGDAWESAAVE